MIRDTSIKTYYQIIDEGILGERQVEVYELLYQKPNLTDREITVELHQVDPNYARPRRKELLDMGLIESSGKRQCSITHREVYQWRALEQAQYKKLPRRKDKLQCPTCKGKGYVWIGQTNINHYEEVGEDSVGHTQ